MQPQLVGEKLQTGGSFTTATAVLLCLISTLLVAGCSRQAGTKEKSMKPLSLSFEEQSMLFSASKTEFEAEERWDSLKRMVDPLSPIQIQDWLHLQQMILTNSPAVYSNESLRRSAIQEFFLFFEHVKPFRQWLEDSKRGGVFKDPFVVQNVDMVLDALDRQR